LERFGLDEAKEGALIQVVDQAGGEGTLSSQRADLETGRTSSPAGTEEEQRPRPEEPLTARLARVARNSVANLLRLGAAWLVILVVPPLLVRALDGAEYATWMLVLQLAAYASLLDGGLQLAIGRFVARAEHAEDKQYLSTILSSAAAMLICGAVLLLALTAGVAMNLGSLFHSIPAAVLPQARTALLLVGASLSIGFPFSALAGYFLGREKNHVNAAAGAVSRFAGAAGTVWAALHHRGLAEMGLWTGAGNLTQPLIFFLASRSIGLKQLFHAGLVKLGMIAEFARFCSAMLATQFSMLLITGLDLPIVVAFDFGNAGYYAVAATVANMLLVPHGSVLSTLVPMMSSMSAGEPAERMGRVVVRTTRISTAVLSLAAVPLMAGMPMLLRLWVGPAYARQALPYAEVLVGAQLIRLTLMPYAIIGFSAGEQSRMLISPLAEGGVNLVCSVALARIMGATGVAVGTVAGAIVGAALHFWNSMPRTRGLLFRRRELLWEGMLRPLGLSAIATVLLVALLASVTAVAAKIALLCGAVITFGLVLWNRQLRSEDRAVIERLATRFLPLRAAEKIPMRRRGTP